MPYNFPTSNVKEIQFGQVGDRWEIRLLNFKEQVVAREYEISRDRAMLTATAINNSLTKSVAIVKIAE